MKAKLISNGEYLIIDMEGTGNKSILIKEFFVNSMKIEGDINGLCTLNLEIITGEVLALEESSDFILSKEMNSPSIKQKYGKRDFLKGIISMKRNFNFDNKS